MKKTISFLLVVCIVLGSFSTTVFAAKSKNDDKKEKSETVLNCSYTKGSTKYNFKIIEKSSFHKPRWYSWFIDIFANKDLDIEGLYVSQYVFKVTESTADKEIEYTYKTKDYSKFFAPNTLANFAKKDPALKEKKVYDLYSDYLASNNILFAAISCDPKKYEDFFSDEVTEKILATIEEIEKDLCNQVKDKTNPSDSFLNVYIDRLSKNCDVFRSYTTALYIADFAEALRSGVEETNLLIEALNKPVDFLAEVAKRKTLDVEISCSVKSYEEFLDFVNNKFVVPEAEELRKAIVEIVETGESDGNKNCIIKTTNLYTTNMQRIESQKYTYPTFSFNYPDGWSVTRDEMDLSRSDVEYEWLILKNERGAEINYYQLDIGFQQYYSAMGLCEASLTKVADSDFIPTVVSGTDFSSTGKFVVAKLEVHTIVDRDTGERRKVDNDTPMYAVVPESYLGETSFTGAGYYGALSWKYPTPIVVFAKSPQESDFTKQEEKEIIEILVSFKER